MPRSLNRLVLLLVSLFCLFSILLLSSFFGFPATRSSSSQHSSSLRPDVHDIPPDWLPVVSLASSAGRIDNELPITLESLIRQTLKPREIRVYLPEEDRDHVQRRLSDKYSKSARRRSSPPPTRWDRRVKAVASSEPLSEYLSHPLVKVIFTPDRGPATKFLPALEEMIQKGQGGRSEWFDVPLVVVDDDHAYTPYMLQTLISAHLSFSSPSSSPSSHPSGPAALGFRGWRIRRDMEWGVEQEELSWHVIHGWQIAEPYRVGIVTANEGYLVLPRLFVGHSSDGNKPDINGSVPVLETRSPPAPPSAHLVDDIWINGHLSLRSIPRYVIPSPSFQSLDVTSYRALESHMNRDGVSRFQANTDTLRWFARGWEDEGLWYALREGGVDAVKSGGKGGARDGDPVWIGRAEWAVKEVKRVAEMARVKLRFPRVVFV